LVRQPEVTALAPRVRTQGIASIPYGTGSVIIGSPPESKPLAFTNEGEIVMAEAAVGKGRVIALSTVFALLQASEPFAKQLLEADEPLPAIAANKTAAAAAGQDVASAKAQPQPAKLAGESQVAMLGLTLAEPTAELMDRYQLPAQYPGPIMTKVT